MSREGNLSSMWSELHSSEQELFQKFIDDDGLYSSDAEWAVLGAAMGSRGQKTISMIPDLRPEHFFYTPHQHLYRHILGLCHEGKDPDPIILSTVVAQHPDFTEMLKLSSCTSVEYMRRLMSNASCENPVLHAQLIMSLYHRRVMVHSFRHHYRRLRDTHSFPDTEQIISEFVAHVSEIPIEGKSKTATIHQVSASVYDSLFDNLAATPTGIELLDKALLGGFHRGRTYCFMAPPKAGKSMLMGSIFYNVVMAREVATYYAFEMGPEELQQRFLARFIGTNTSEFVRNKTKPEFQQRIAEANRVLRENNITGLYIDCPGMMFDDLKRSLISAVNRNKSAGFFIDYLGKIGMPKDYTGLGRAKFEEDVADWLELFSKKYKVWVCYAAQVNREGKMRGGDGGIMGADSVYELVRDPETNTAHLKHRASRYTALCDIGTGPTDPGLRIGPAPYYRCATSEVEDYSDMEKLQGLHANNIYKEIPL